MGGTTSTQVGKKKQEKQPSISRLSSKSEFDMGESYLDTMLTLHDNDLVLLNYNCDQFIPDIKYGIISRVLSAKSFTVLCPITRDSANNKHKLYSFVLHLNNIIVPTVDSGDENETQAAIKLQEYVHDIMYNTCVYLEDVKINDDGRIFCDMKFRSTDMDVKTYFIEQNMAVSYGTITPEDWLNYILKDNVYYSIKRRKN